MKSLAQIEKAVAAMRKTEKALKPVRAKNATIRAKREVELARAQVAFEAEQKPKRLLFAALFNAPAPEPKRTIKPISKSAKRRIKLHQQFEALCDVQDCFVRRAHR